MNARVGIARWPWILLVVVLVWFSGAAAAQTQGEMNRDACAEQKEAEQKLRKTYAEILRNYHADKSFIKHMQSAQRAWLAYREAHLRSLYPHEDLAEYGSVYDMCLCSALAEITNNRIKELEQWTQGIEMGDVCTGSRAVR